jgi:DNA (cytosine-5)-methyltransferase 1
MRFGSLFSGIGGLDAGLEQAGLSCAWQVEINEYAQKVLTKHWPAVPKFRDVRDVGAHNLEPVQLVAGGFPCTDISNAGKRAGIDGEQSGLWSEYFRILCEIRPDFVLVENVAALLIRGLDRVLGDLASIGYDAEWSTLSACALGAPHPRERLFIIANAQSVTRIHKPNITQGAQRLPDYADYWRSNPWDEAKSRICRVDDVVPNRVERTSGLGNAVLPVIAKWIGRRILTQHQESICHAS